MYWTTFQFKPRKRYVYFIITNISHLCTIKKNMESSKWCTFTLNVKHMALKAETGCKINCLYKPSDVILKDTSIFHFNLGLFECKRVTRWQQNTSGSHICSQEANRHIQTFKDIQTILHELSASLVWKCLLFNPCICTLCMYVFTNTSFTCDGMSRLTIVYLNRKQRQITN